MANIKKHAAKKVVAKKSATRGEALVLDTYSCGCCRPVVSVDACGCMETRILCS